MRNKNNSFIYELDYQEIQRNSLLKRRRFFSREDKTSYLMILFPMIWWSIFFVYAFIRAIYFSFTDLTLDVSNITVFFTFDNYVRLFKDVTFWAAFKNTLIWTVSMTLANNVLGLIFAYLITKMKKGQKLFLTLLFWPTLVSSVASTEITKQIFNPSESGILNSIIIFFGGNKLAWYNDKSLALITLMIMPLLLGFSSQMIIYYVALKGVNQSQIEAAKIDGAKGFSIFKNIYVPSITKAINYNVILSIISGVRIMAPMQLIADNPLIAGGPDNSTITVVLYLYQNILNNEMAYACAIGAVTTIIIVCFSILQRKVSKNNNGF